jgi:hypothetical protein
MDLFQVKSGKTASPAGQMEHETAGIIVGLQRTAVEQEQQTLDCAANSSRLREGFERSNLT